MCAILRRETHGAIAAGARLLRPRHLLIGCRRLEPSGARLNRAVRLVRFGLTARLDPRAITCAYSVTTRIRSGRPINVRSKRQVVAVRRTMDRLCRTSCRGVSQGACHVTSNRTGRRSSTSQCRRMRSIFTTSPPLRAAQGPRWYESARATSYRTLEPAEPTYCEPLPPTIRFSM